MTITIDRFQKISELGSGTYGEVYKAIDKITGEIVAIKKLKRRYKSWEECLNIREYKCLYNMMHSNVVFLKGIIHEEYKIFLVFEYMESNLQWVIMENHKHPLSKAKVRKLCYQMFDGLTYVHKSGYIHRDLKPANMLVTNDIIKIADFGLVRKFYQREQSIFPLLEDILYSGNKGVFGGPLTEYVCTRWYAAPEILLHSTNYTTACDMWSMGLIMAEMFYSEPLFKGINEFDQLNQITQVLGTPNKHSWAEGLQLAESINYQFPQFSGVDFSMLIPSASSDAINLIKSLCSWNPNDRPTAAEVLRHPYFKPYILQPPPLLPTADIDTTLCRLTAEEVVLMKERIRSSIFNAFGIPLEDQGSFFSKN